MLYSLRQFSYQLCQAWRRLVPSPTRPDSGWNQRSLRGPTSPCCCDSNYNLHNFSRTNTVMGHGWSGTATQDYHVSKLNRCVGNERHTWTAQTDKGMRNLET